MKSFETALGVMLERSVYRAILIGFGLICCVNVSCFFPATFLPHAAHESLRVFNGAVGISSVLACVVWIAVLSDRFLVCRGRNHFLVKTLNAQAARQTHSALLACVGYIFVACSIIPEFLHGLQSSWILAGLRGVFAGVGICWVMLFWFCSLRFVPERQAAFTQGWQALLGEVLFIAITGFQGVSFPLVSLIFVGISGCCAYITVRHTSHTLEGQVSYRNLEQSSYDSTSSLASAPLLQNLKTYLRMHRSTLAVSVFPLSGFVIVSLLYGAIESLAMAVQDASPWGYFASVWGAPIGAVVFLVWLRISKRRDYRFATLLVFTLLAVVLGVVPFDVVAFLTALVFQISGLLAYSLIIDDFAHKNTSAFIVLGLAYGLSHGAYLVGLFLPRWFGVQTYATFFQSTSLVLFFVYAVFGVLLFLNHRQAVRLEQQLERIKREEHDAGALQSSSGYDNGVLQEASLLYSDGSRRHESEDDQRENEAELPDGGAVSYEEVYRLACDSLCRSHGLTKREGEVLSLLAKGRDAAYICEELCLARNTVKSYAKSIYAKVGIHSKQELIDRVEVACAHQRNRLQ